MPESDNHDYHVRAYEAAQQNSHVVRFLQLRYEFNRVIYRWLNPITSREQLAAMELSSKEGTPE